MVQYGESWVCAACKPAFFQKVKEGASLPNRLVYAGFWIRFAAVLIDGVLMYIVNTAISGIFGIGGIPGGGEPSMAQVMAIFGGSIANMAIAIAYETWMIGKFGATVGKMAVGLKVVRPDGTPMTYMRAFGRYWAKVLSSLTLLIGYIMAGFDSEKRALHDRICDTRVVRSR